MNTRFFFYGTLMRGHGRSHVLDGLAHRVSPALIRGRIHSVSGAFPAYVETGHGLVIGEVWEANDEALVPTILARLDAIESYREHAPEHSMYLRHERELVAPEGCTAWVYVWNGSVDRLEHVESGCWRSYDLDRRGAWLEREQAFDRR